MKLPSLPVAVCLVLASALNGLAETHYVDLNNAAPSPPFTDWFTAATNIQDAIDAAADGELILVTNGVYSTGGRIVYGSLTNRVVVDRAVTVQSVNGPDTTIILGYKVPDTVVSDAAVRCAYLTNGATLIGFTLTNGATRKLGDLVREQSGGGLWCESAEAMASNCVIAANACYWKGGGVHGGTLADCTLIENTNWNFGCYEGGHAADLSTLTGCTVTRNGAGPLGFGGSVYSCLMSNCVVSENHSGGTYDCALSACLVFGNLGTGVRGGTATGCTIFSNTVAAFNATSSGGGAFAATLNRCVLYGNVSTNGGGAYNCTLNSCWLSNNVALSRGGGAYNAVGALGLSNRFVGNSAGDSGGGLYVLQAPAVNLTNWTFSGNIAGNSGGGLYSSPRATLSSCTFSNNSALSQGGGLYAANTLTMNDCDFTGNMSGADGGGLLAYLSPNTCWNCVFTGNSSGGNGGGIRGGFTCSNCLFEANTAGLDGGGGYSAMLWNCRVVGNQGRNGGGVYGSATGCEFVGNAAAANGGGIYGSATDCAFTGNSTSSNGGAFYFTNYFLGNCNNSAFTNNVAANGGGVYASSTLALSNAVLWANSAATNGGGVFGRPGVIIRDSLVVSNRATYGGGLYNVDCRNCSFIGNRAAITGGGVYSSSGEVNPTNCIFFENSAGYEGGGTYRGSLTACTLKGNSAVSGGGAFSAFLDRCILSNNSATNSGGGASDSYLGNCLLTANSAQMGGGASGGSLTGCTVDSNSATGSGGGAFYSSLNNCLLTANSAQRGGGTLGGSLTGCTVVGNVATIQGGGVMSGASSTIIYYNDAPEGMNVSGNMTYLNCCTTPLPLGSDNITNEPGFLDLTGGNLRLRADSPCINKGRIYSGLQDLDGRPRVVGGTVDIGAYEFQGVGMGEFIAWLEQHGLQANGSADYTDADGDRMNNWQEWRARTDPTNALSLLRLLPLAPETSGLTVRWQSVGGVNYFLQQANDLGSSSSFSTIQSNIVGLPDITEVTDTNAAGGGPFFYRVGVE